MLNRRTLLRIAPALLFIASGCASIGKADPDAPAPAVIHFNNQSLDQADVYAVVGGLDARRLGTVLPGRTEALRVPVDVTSRAGTVNIVARLLARSYSASTGSVSLFAGDEYSITLPSNSATLSFLPARQP